ncbi:peptide-methionine (S)-S-oxide reductase MsrA [Knoellia koreensis]|uniref:Peptide methionine sulfoxide reductase MsrA n=1 Tax=Knoellia koreensis TaxID=2730921 RepID=A0A849HHF7_9MICO|nr:peptide-methionine (S)-S-oxide reductase MsrA [Knoellia sp. DB2414S]NNM46639.1 peptide-methionine (S)-S-oxide reductase MsrA [Knoellia sp. DB2414S]
MFFSRDKSTMPTAETALRGRDERPFQIAPEHLVLHTPVEGSWPEGTQVIYFAMGCFWGAERIFWQQPGVVTTAAGYMGGLTPNPTYEETTTGRTGHAETVLVAYDPEQTSAELLLKEFWENHDPTTANRQGNDIGTAYRSAIYWTTEEQRLAAEATKEAFQKVLTDNGFGPITTEIRSAKDAGPFYYAEDYHQQYLFKNPGGYCNHGFKGMTCPVGIVKQDQLPSQQEVLRAESADE